MSQIKKKSEFAKQPTGDKAILIAGYIILACSWWPSSSR